MDKVLSARLDESAIAELEQATRQLRITKKKFLEDAIREYARQVRTSDSTIWADTFGAWNRKEKPEKTVDRARDTFRRNFERHGKS
jgi:hypothetical protein